MTALTWKLSAEHNFTKYFSEINFTVKMVKERNFLRVVLLFDARFIKYYQFSSHYHKQWPINNIILIMWLWLLITTAYFSSLSGSAILWFIQTCHLENFKAKKFWHKILLENWFPSLKKTFPYSQKHVLETQMAWNQKLSSNPAGECLQPPLAGNRFM